MMDDITGLSELYGGLAPERLLEQVMTKEFPGRIALVSSFGAEAAVLLHMVAQVNRSLPVLFLDTRKLFGETKKYRDLLVELLGLTDVRTITPLLENEKALDPQGVLWASEPNRCCYFRKVLPLQRALEGFDAWITGRKQYQNTERAQLPVFELADGRIKVNPLMGWGAAQIEAYFEVHNLPEHPKVKEGYPSIGCMTCTDRVAVGEDQRAGRWRGQAKSECGIHLPSSSASGSSMPIRTRRSLGCG